MATATDGQRAHDILLSFAPLSKRGACWYYVWQAYAQAGASTSMGSTPTAYKGWEVSLGKHPGDRNPPPGAAIWLGKRLSDGNMDGDVFIAGQYDGDHAATDYPGWNQVGRCSIQARINQTGREYLGWTDHVCDAPIIMGGTTPPAGNERIAGSNGANARPQPNRSQPPVADKFLAPGVKGTFDGWINGENVEGQPVWFRGAYSGLWFWAGGFTDQGTHDLANLNPPAAGNVRTAVAAGANVRSTPDPAGSKVGFIDPNASVAMDGWITGVPNEGNATWFHLADGSGWAWSGGFTDTGTHDLADMNTPVPPDPADNARTAVSDGAKVRSAPYKSSAQTGFIDGGTSMEMTGWAPGDEVEGNDVWFQHALGWSWSGGFTSTSTDGIPQVTPPDPGPTPDDHNPRGLPAETGYQWPLAQLWLNAPLGHTKCEDPNSGYALRTTAGSDKHPVDPIIDTYIVHWTDTRDDDRAAADWHSYCNSRSSCPTTQLDRDGFQTQFIRPMAKPASTGPDWNWRSFAVETVGGPGYDFTDDQWGVHAQNIAYLHHLTVTGQPLDGVPVSVLIDHDHVKGHGELPGMNVECPGAAQIAYFPTLLVRAQEVYDDVYGEDPENPVLDPEKYPTLWALHNELRSAFGS